MSQSVRCATAVAGMAGGALGLFHLGPHGMQVVAGRDYWEQQNECAAESTNEDKRAPCLTPTRINRIARRNPLPPQQPGRQQQREPTKIKKKLHTKRAGRVEEGPRPWPGVTATR